ARLQPLAHPDEAEHAVALASAIGRLFPVTSFKPQIEAPDIALPGELAGLVAAGSAGNAAVGTHGAATVEAALSGLHRPAVSLAGGQREREGGGLRIPVGGMADAAPAVAIPLEEDAVGVGHVVVVPALVPLGLGVGVR